MLRNDRLRTALAANQQRLVARALAKPLEEIFGDAPIIFADPIISTQVDTMVRSALRDRRPLEDGELLITRDPHALKTRIKRYFEQRQEDTFYVFLAHSEGAGGILLPGAALAERALQLLDSDGDAIYGISKQLNEIFSLDRTENGPSPVYEIFTFSHDGYCHNAQRV
jgi:hypothetical protein